MKTYISTKAIEAIQFNEESKNEILEIFKKQGAYIDDSETLVIPTPNRTLFCKTSDFIVKDNGSLEIMSESDFEETYQEFEEIEEELDHEEEE